MIILIITLNKNNSKLFNLINKNIILKPPINADMIILINFTCICLLINPILLIGIFLILLLKKLNKPIDISYLILLLYIVIYYKTIYSFIFIILLLIQILCSKTNTIKFMMTIELSFLIIIFTIL